MINITETISKLDDADLQTRIAAYDALVFDTPEISPDWYVYFAGALRDKSPTIRFYGVFALMYLRRRFALQYVLAPLLDHSPDQNPGLRMLIENLLKFFLSNDPTLLRDRIDLNLAVRPWQQELWKNLKAPSWQLIAAQIDDLMVRLTDRYPIHQPQRPVPAKSIRQILAQIKFEN